jgi:hypothetical protein
MIIAHAGGVEVFSSIMFLFNGLERAEDVGRQNRVRPHNLLRSLTADDASEREGSYPAFFSHGSRSIFRLSGRTASADADAYH